MATNPPLNEEKPSKASAPCSGISGVRLLPGESPEEALRRSLKNDPRASFLWFKARLRHQRPDGYDWTTWLLLGGRGAGKTRAGAEWTRHVAERFKPKFGNGAGAIALVAESYADAREIMIEGPSGLRAIAHETNRPVYEASRRRLVWKNGAEARIFSAEDPDGIRGYQFDAAWCDEL